MLNNIPGTRITRITSRRLARETRRLLDDVDSGLAFVIIRHDRPVAVLAPIEELNRAGSDARVEDPPAIRLDAVESQVLSLIWDGLHTEQVVSKSGLSLGEVAMALASLEAKGLIIKARWGYKVTRNGAPVARRLRGHG